MCDRAPREKAADGERDQKDNDSHLWINSPQRNLPKAPPNGSRLSCGASAGRRKRPALRYELVGAQTYASSESRPRQLQALVGARLLRRPNIDRKEEPRRRRLNSKRYGVWPTGLRSRIPPPQIQLCIVGGRVPRGSPLGP